jgi:hypothetical protein
LLQGEARLSRCHRAAEIEGQAWPIPEAPEAVARPTPTPLLVAEGLARSFGGGEEDLGLLKG